MKTYYYGILLNAFFISAMVSGANVSCNERMRHGPKGLAKGALALVGGAATLYMVSELKDTTGPFRVPREFLGTGTGKRDEAFQNSLFTGCALLAVGYVTWKLASSSIESLKIYFDDSEDLQLGVKKVVEDTEKGQPADTVESL